jgi:hypothetical protein
MDEFFDDDAINAMVEEEQANSSINMDLMDPTEGQMMDAIRTFQDDQDRAYVNRMSAEELDRALNNETRIMPVYAEDSLIKAPTQRKAKTDRLRRQTQRRKANLEDAFEDRRHTEISPLVDIEPTPYDSGYPRRGVAEVKREDVMTPQDGPLRGVTEIKWAKRCLPTFPRSH